MKRVLATAAIFAVALGALSLGTAIGHGQDTGVDHKRIVRAEARGEWATHGLGYTEQRFSPLKRVTTENVGQLGVAWYYQFDTDRGQEATPLVVDGVLYTTTAWSKVYALDARTGALKWSFDPGVDGQKGLDACCDVVNRGVAIWGDKIYVGALDGRLIALNKNTGARVWEIQTTDTARPYTITGAPRVVKGKVLIGNGGAEYGVRGYLSAYDSESGKLIWRFYTTPNPDGKPDGAASDEALRKKAQGTWFGQVWKQTGGGGTVWDSMAYDPDLDILYFGVGNGTPWNHKIRSDGRGDNLFLSSIVAVKPDSGKYLWHYQTTPGESWDYTATQHIVIADLPIAGKKRRVVMQAPKNGFFYVLDAKKGTLISAEKYVPVNWAEKIDAKTGRPVEAAFARYLDGASRQVSGPLGGHNWQPMAFNPREGLMFIPAIVMPGNYSQPADFKYTPGLWNTGQGGMGGGAAGARPQGAGAAPAQPNFDFRQLGGRLIAWDPVQQKARWSVRFGGIWNSGLLATDGGLVFAADGSNFNAYAARDGKPLWSYPAKAGIIAAPMTYEIDGQQYVAVMVGPGGAAAVALGGARQLGRLIVFKLGGTARAPDYDAPEPPRPALDLTLIETPVGDIAQGQRLFGQYCTNCHGGGGFLPELRTSPTLTQALAWKAVVHDGALKDRGMAGFARFMSEAETESVRAYLVDTLKPRASGRP